MAEAGKLTLPAATFGLQSAKETLGVVNSIVSEIASLPEKAQKGFESFKKGYFEGGILKAYYNYFSELFAVDAGKYPLSKSWVGAANSMLGSPFDIEGFDRVNEKPPAGADFADTSRKTNAIWASRTERAPSRTSLRSAPRSVRCRRRSSCCSAWCGRRSLI